MKRTTAIAAALLLAAQPALAESTRYGLDAEVLYDDNASRGLYDADRKADNILSLEGSATRSMLLGARSGAVFRAAARYSHFTEFGDLSNLALTGRAAWRIQPVAIGGSAKAAGQSGVQLPHRRQSAHRDAAEHMVARDLHQPRVGRVAHAEAVIERRPEAGGGEVVEPGGAAPFALVHAKPGAQAHAVRDVAAGARLQRQDGAVAQLAVRVLQPNQVAGDLEERRTEFQARLDAPGGAPGEREVAQVVERVEVAVARGGAEHRAAARPEQHAARRRALQRQNVVGLAVGVVQAAARVIVVEILRVQPVARGFGERGLGGQQERCGDDGGALHASSPGWACA